MANENNSVDNVNFLQQGSVQSIPVTTRRRVRKEGLFGSANNTITNSLDTVTGSVEAIRRTVGLANQQLKATALEIELDIYEDIMERGYTLAQAKEMLEAV